MFAVGNLFCWVLFGGFGLSLAVCGNSIVSICALFAVLLLGVIGFIGLRGVCCLIWLLRYVICGLRY